MHACCQSICLGTNGVKVHHRFSHIYQWLQHHISLNLTCSSLAGVTYTRDLYLRNASQGGQSGDLASATEPKLDRVIITVIGR